MKNLRFLAIGGGAVLLLTATYSVHSSSDDDKMAIRQAKEQVLQLKKQAAMNAALDLVNNTAMRPRTSSLRNGAGDMEPNNTFADATPIELVRDGIGAAAAGTSSSGTTAGGAAADKICVDVIGAIDVAKDIDTYKVDLLAGEVVCVAIHSHQVGAPHDPFVTVYGPSATVPPAPCGGPIAQADDTFGSDDSLDACTFFRAATAGTYFIEVKDLIGLTGGPDQTYDLSLCIQLSQEKLDATNNTVAEPFVDCVGSSSTPSASSSGTTTTGGATCTPRSRNVTGLLDNANDVDCYSVCVQKGEVIQGTVIGAQCANRLNCTTASCPDKTHAMPDPNICITAGTNVCHPCPSSGCVASNNCPAGNSSCRRYTDDVNGADPAAILTAAQAGTYTVCVAAAAGTFTNQYYKLEVNTFCNGELEPNNSCATAQAVIIPRGAGSPTTTSSK